jgi:topoisomerase-4 subunit B
MTDLFEENKQPVLKPGEAYSAEDIQVLEGLEPVRHRPGMYIGGTDEKACHHLFAEVLDNSMDEAVAGFATRIEVEMDAEGYLTVRDNGRGIPVDEHKKFPGKSALEVILTTLHSGGKFSNKVYQTSGGLHGVGLSVVNALSEKLEIEIARDRKLYQQSYSRGHPLTSIIDMGPVSNRRGTSLRFKPDAEIFKEYAEFKPGLIYKMARSKAYLFRGVEIRWKCDPALLEAHGLTGKVPESEKIHFPNGLEDFLQQLLEKENCLTPGLKIFAGTVDFSDQQGKLEWAVAWPEEEVNSYLSTYCNTIPTPQGGTHENGLRMALTRSIRSYGELIGQKKASQITPDDVLEASFILLSIYIPSPQFQGQTKEKLTNPEAARLVEQALKDRFDHWLSLDPGYAETLFNTIFDRAEERRKRKQDKEQTRKTATRRLRLPGKLSDCSRNEPKGTELFLVEGDSAGGSAKQGRNREIQAILPLRGKILNVANATQDKMRANQELSDLVLALGCGIGKDFDLSKLRYEKIIIMTDADVDGAHIASLLMTFFYQQMPKLIEAGHLFLAQPPLYRLSHNKKSFYAHDDNEKNHLLATEFAGIKKVDISRFKGLGEMQPKQLKETTMDPANRVLLKVVLEAKASGDNENIHLSEEEKTITLSEFVENLMGKNPQKRYEFIQENASFEIDLDV